ncbi:MAG TPA: 4-(cytidine 5'-diphospho)-2-C-methyl-D-erythritol kinase, partial [Xanthobacteraceae bacterium]|nr:4-(cytidine 5'-diphospho)-2-C-methyl-D-erythritol kinase [Xanthobacteraceae bacterium]
ARILAAARATGADVPVCVPRKARIMRGIGELLSEPLALPPLAALLANPGVPLATRDVFARLRLTSQRRAPAGAPANARAALLAFIAEHGNDLERAAIGLQPVIADVLMDLRRLPGCLIAQMSGSGATCFALFPSRRAALSAARHLRASRPNWWVRATVLQ